MTTQQRPCRHDAASPKRECRRGWMGVRWQLSSRHGQLRFPVFASGL